MNVYGCVGRMIAVATMVVAPQASNASFTITQLQATLTVLPSCSVSSLGTLNENGQGPFSSVQCNIDTAPQIAYVREPLLLNASAFVPKTARGAAQFISDKRDDVTVMTLYFF